MQDQLELELVQLLDRKHSLHVDRNMVFAQLMARQVRGALLAAQHSAHLTVVTT
jgi:hypothetical protein